MRETLARSALRNSLSAAADVVELASLDLGALADDSDARTRLMEGVKWLRKAADEDVEEAGYQLGRLYEMVMLIRCPFQPLASPRTVFNC